MIASLSGILKSKSPTEVLLDVNGVGYAVSIPLSTFEKLGAVNSQATLFTHLAVREDALQLYGFATIEERELFRLLLSVNGIGPKIAQGILSGITAADLKSHVSRGNVEALVAIPNVGRKTAERLIIELRDKIDRLQTGSRTDLASDRSASIREQALSALTSLGYQRAAAEKAIRQALNEKNGTSLSVEELIKFALRFTSSK
jgi:Holliday junction DNA helicase RuvA